MFAHVWDTEVVIMWDLDSTMSSGMVSSYLRSPSNKSDMNYPE